MMTENKDKGDTIMKLVKGENTFLIEGAVGPLEIATSVPEVLSPLKTVGIICHPHPLFGGTFRNKVVTTLARAFYLFGLASVRFNFRGVGQSVGVFDEGRGEVDDLRAVMQAVQQDYPDHKIILVGFSFGAYVAAQCAVNNDDCVLLLSIAPAVLHFPFTDVSQIKSPWIILQGETDEVANPQALWDWYESTGVGLANPPQLIRFPNTGHFFHGQLIPLRERVGLILQQYLSSQHPASK